MVGDRSDCRDRHQPEVVGVEHRRRPVYLGAVVVIIKPCVRGRALRAAAEKPSCPPGTPPAAPFKCAVIVAHGLGQQTKFETLATATQGLVKAAGSALAGSPRVRLVTLGQERYQRVELTLRGDGGLREL